MFYQKRSGISPTFTIAAFVLTNCLVILAIPVLGFADSILIKETGQSGAQTQLDINHSYFWKFRYTGSQTFDPVTANFTLKRGPQTTESAVLTLYAADSNSVNQSLLGSYELTAAQASQQYTPHLFTLISGTQTLLPEFFNLALTSNASEGGGSSDPQSESWFIKNPADSSFVFENQTGETVSGFEYLGFGEGNGSEGGSSVPEPGSFVMFGLVVGLGGLGRRRRSRCG